MKSINTQGKDNKNDNQRRINSLNTKNNCAQFIKRKNQSESKRNGEDSSELCRNINDLREKYEEIQKRKIIENHHNDKSFATPSRLLPLKKQESYRRQCQSGPHSWILRYHPSRHNNRRHRSLPDYEVHTWFHNKARNLFLHPKCRGNQTKTDQIRSDT